MFTPAAVVIQYMKTVTLELAEEAQKKLKVAEVSEDELVDIFVG